MLICTYTYIACEPIVIVVLHMNCWTLNSEIISYHLYFLIRVDIHCLGICHLVCLHGLSFSSTVTVTLGIYLHVYLEIVVFVFTVIWHTYFLLLCAASNLLLLYAAFWNIFFGVYICLLRLHYIHLYIYINKYLEYHVYSVYIVCATLKQNGWCRKRSQCWTRWKWWTWK